jgi:hypothetical protein
MGKQQQIVKSKPAPKRDTPSDAPTVNKSIARKWFS